MPDYVFEKEAALKGYNLVCGVDEAGRGPLAGPVCAAAVILPTDLEIKGLNDSKKLSEKKREELFPIICEKAISFSIAFASVEEIEEYNILGATFIAMNRAIEGLGIKADFALVDGNRVPKGCSIPVKTVVKGDSLSMSIAAASVLAKVSRDRYMLELDLKYPQYNFKKHKGYGTAEHIELIRRYGISECHRPSFLKKL
jgi:ribonuclease HII